ncbi:MAG: diguanylate cyclase domain-containing protein [Clostridium sp.]|uniref:diguanylate cyclase domain-containing protein n=1 Tax=Clostridium sp. TaxID=1506 RepID=UPI003D6D051A
MRDENIKTILFSILCIVTSLWIIGYTFMLIYPTIEISNIWRIVAAIGWCFFNSIWISFVFSLKKSNLKLKNEIKDRRRAEDQIRLLIYYDALTQIFNSKKMLEDVDVLLEDKNKKFAILFIDLDKFKSVNDSYGHQAGDNILKLAAMRLKNIIRSTDTIYRIGGDEFIIILRDLEGILNAQKIAANVLEALTTTFAYKQHQLCIGATIGISIFPKDGIDVETLIKKADLAMYELKRRGGNGYNIYSPELEENSNNSSMKIKSYYIF